MATFEGTIAEFIHFFGNNLLSNAASSYSKPYKKILSTKCEWEEVKKHYHIKQELEPCECDLDKPLESAHRHKKHKIYLAIQILKKYKKNEEPAEIIKIDIDKFLQEFKKLHDPISETFYTLCNYHHSRYDNPQKYKGLETIKLEKSEIDREISTYKDKPCSNYHNTSNDDMEFIIDGISSKGKRSKFKFTHAFIKKLVLDNPDWDFNDLWDVIKYLHNGTKNKIIIKIEKNKSSSLSNKTYNLKDQYLIDIKGEKYAILHSINEETYKRVLTLYRDRKNFL